MKTDSTSFIEPAVFPLTPERWDDFETLFRKNGACDGCWCMWWRQTHSRFTKNCGEPNRRAMHEIVHSKRIPGILAYDRDNPVGWCSVAPREEFGRLNRSPNLRPIDERPVWSVVCFFVHRIARGHGVMRALLSAAVHYAVENGATIVEGYPLDTTVKHYSAADLYVGTIPLFTAAGFVELARRSRNRPIMRYMAESRISDHDH